MGERLLETEDYINNMNMEFVKIYYFTELSHFTNLVVLRCSNNNLKIIPTLPRTLVHLYCNNNMLISLPRLPFNLSTLVCNNNQLTMIPLLPPKLSVFICNNNQLLYLPELPRRTLNHFNCIRNPFIEYFRNGKRICIETINETNEIVCRFRHLYYLLKYKWRFVELLAKIVMKPENITKMLDNQILSLETTKLDTFNIL